MNTLNALITCIAGVLYGVWKGMEYIFFALARSIRFLLRKTQVLK